jgi:C1A family cysteine protease
LETPSPYTISIISSSYLRVCENSIFPWNEKYLKVKERFENDKEKYLNAAMPYKIINYFRLYNDKEIKITLMKQGAVVLGMPIYSSFKAECPLPADTDTKEGGHAMCLIGWDEAGWIIQNSWGKYWGNKGLCHIPYDYPVDEWWGITVDTDVPMPEKKNFLQKIIDFLSFIIKKFKK